MAFAARTLNLRRVVLRRYLFSAEGAESLSSLGQRPRILKEDISQALKARHKTKEPTPNHDASMSPAFSAEGKERTNPRALP